MNKKIFFSILLFFFLSKYLNSQNFKLDDIKETELVIIFNKDSSVVRIKSKTDEKFLNGLKRIIYQDNSYSTLNFENGFPNGEWIIVSNDGKYEFIGSYIKGKKHGTHTYFYLDGNKRLIEKYIDGYQEGKTLMFYPNGKLGGEFFCIKGKKYGVEKWFDFEKKVIRKEYYIGGEKVDSVSFHKSFGNGSE